MLATVDALNKWAEYLGDIATAYETVDDAYFGVWDTRADFARAYHQDAKYRGYNSTRDTIVMLPADDGGYHAFVSKEK